MPEPTTKATLILDAQRRDEQLAYVAERTAILAETGDRLWVALYPPQVDLFTARGIAVQLQPEADLVQVPAGTFDPLVAVPEPPPGLRAAPAGSAVRRLVQFDAPPSADWISEITRLGAVPARALPPTVMAFSMTEDVAETVHDMPHVRWVGPYHPAYAVGSTLTESGEWLTMPGTAPTIDPATMSLAGDGNAQVLLFDDADADEAAVALEQAGAVIRTRSPQGHVVGIDPERVLDLARLEQAFAVETFLPAQVGNTRAGVIMGTNQVRSVVTDFLVNLDGAGEVVGVVDTGIDAGIVAAVSLDLRGRVLAIDNTANPGVPAADTHPHGTHVTGSIVGNGALSGGGVKGMAPAAFVYFDALSAISARLQWERAHVVGARVHSNSWASVGFSRNRYTTAPDGSDGIDQWCWEHPESLVVFLAHNQEADAVPAPGGNGQHDMRWLPAESVAKNVLTVGACESQRNDAGVAATYRALFKTKPAAKPIGQWPHNVTLGGWPHKAFDTLADGSPTGFTTSDNADEVALFSNRGLVTAPGAGAAAATGRIKPDLVAPGTNILSLRSSAIPAPSGAANEPPAAVAPPASYQLLTGTSMATPLVAGSALLVRQYYRARYGQLRRPLLVEGVPSPSTPPPPAFVDLAAMAPHADGFVAAWVPAGPGAAKRTIRATRMSRDLVALAGGSVELQDDVGDAPAPALARHGERTVLMYRGKDSAIRLKAFDRALTLDKSFGTAGSVRLAPDSRADPLRPPAMIVAGDEIAVAWADGSADTLRLQRFDARTGAAVDPVALTLGPLAHASQQPYLAHDGISRYAAAWVATGGAGQRLLLRFVDPAGPVGNTPLTLVDQAQSIRDPSLIRDAGRTGWALAWCDARSKPGGDVRVRFLDSAGATVGTEVVTIEASADTKTRRPLLLSHPIGGYALLWEDDTQDKSFDVYLALLDAAGLPDARIAANAADPSKRRALRVSDTPSPTTGATARIDAQGISILWQSLDEINSDSLGVFAVGVTLNGVFRAQVDPGTPLLRSGEYVNHVVTEAVSILQRDCSAVSSGGGGFLVRIWPGAALPELQLMRTGADGAPDPAYGANGVRVLRTGQDLEAVALHWAGDRLACFAVSPRGEVRVDLLDSAGEPIAKFGVGGTVAIAEPGVVRPGIAPALGHPDARKPADFRLIVAYGVGDPVAQQVRYAVVDAKGNVVTGPRNLAQADGTAPHGWFEFVRQEAHAIAVWHRVVAGRSQVFVNRYAVNGDPEHADIQLSPTLPGASSNAVVAPRPISVNGSSREYGVAWEHRPAAGQPAELRFSRLQADGKPMPTPGPPAPPTSEVLVIGPGSPSWPADTNALLPQLQSTFVHEPWATVPAGVTAPQWSPGYGLAWLGQPLAGGDRTLHFTVLDETGRRAMLPQPPPAARAPAPITQLSTAGAGVKSFKLAWNGRTFRLTWIESDGIVTRHVQAALTRHGSRVAFDSPSAALVRATLVNGATNIGNTALPNVNVPGGNLAHGYGWGRVNLRQSLAPSPPVTFHVRDDEALGPGRSAIYRFTLPPRTALLRATLCWTDPPGARVVNHLHLRVTPPGSKTHLQGNDWQAPPNAWKSRAVAKGARFKGVETTEQIVLEKPPPGTYVVEVIAEIFPANPFNQSNVQPFALVFVGSGAEVRFGGTVPAVVGFY